MSPAVVDEPLPGTAALIGADMDPSSNSVAIDRPVDEVFALLSDFDKVPKWNYVIAKRGRAGPNPSPSARRMFSDARFRSRARSGSR